MAIFHGASPSKCDNSSPELDGRQRSPPPSPGLIEYRIVNLESQHDRRTRVATDTLASDGLPPSCFQSFDPNVFVERWVR